MIFLLIIAAAVALLLWPEKGIKTAIKQDQPLPSLPVAAIPQPPKAPSYRSAIESLAAVRSRLISTETLDDKAKAAINDLTLCLVAGSDKE